MRPGLNAHAELTDEENEKFLGTLTQRAWKLLNAKAVKAAWYSDYDGAHIAASLESVSVELFHQALQTSGSIGGQHRRDLKEAIIGAPIQSTGLSVQVAQPEQEQAQAKPKRGL